MRIVDVKVNHFNNPIGYYIDKPCISWKIEDTRRYVYKYKFNV